jgi:hypothetical protein
MSSYYSLDETGINAAYKEQQFKYFAEKYRLHRVLFTNRKTEVVKRRDLFLRLRHTIGLFVRNVHHGSVTSRYSDNPQLVAVENGQTKV